LTEQYDDSFVCIRYRYDEKARKRYKTVEIVVSESDWTPPLARYPDDALVPLKIGIKGTAAQEQVLGVGGISYFDGNLDGAYDLRIGPGSSLAVNYKDNWQPVMRKDKKRYVEADGVLREIEMKDFAWSFLHPQ